MYNALTDSIAAAVESAAVTATADAMLVTLMTGNLLHPDDVIAHGYNVARGDFLVAMLPGQDGHAAGMAAGLLTATLYAELVVFAQ